MTQHAKDEMRDDFLSTSDVKHAILNGRIIGRLTHDPRASGMCSAVLPVMEEKSTWFAGS